MILNTQRLNTIGTDFSEKVIGLRDVYDNLDWEDDVYTSFGCFIDDMQNSMNTIKEGIENANSVALKISDIDIDALEAKLSVICGED